MKKSLIYLFLATFMFNVCAVGAQAKTSATIENGSHLVVIDPGHQEKANLDKEPIGPGASEMKTKVSAGTSGVFTKVPESKLTLDISMELAKELRDRGYEVVLTREKMEVDISNAQRADIANSLKADVFVRIHADGSDDSNVTGSSTLCMTKNNPYNGEYYDDSYRLSKAIVDCLSDNAKTENRGVRETDKMTGINWAKVPVSIVEVGFMTNKEEDILMQTKEHQKAIAVGIANGIDRYFEESKTVNKTQVKARHEKVVRVKDIKAQVGVAGLMQKESKKDSGKETRKDKEKSCIRNREYSKAEKMEITEYFNKKIKGDVIEKKATGIKSIQQNIKDLRELREKINGKGYEIKDL